MVVSKVVISLAVYRCCMEHALSTEKEEVMGLLIGKLDASNVMEVDEETESTRGDTIRFEATKIIRRQDKRRDRVEIPVEQLVFGVQRAESIEKITQVLDSVDSKDDTESKKLRVLGWYHSHPHITVWPSHVDLATQNNYQAMDENFVGIIFSLFNDDNATMMSCLEVTCFQTFRGEDGDMSRISIPIEIEETSCLITSSSDRIQLRREIESERIEVHATLHEEEIEAYKVATMQKGALHNKMEVISAHTEALDIEHATKSFDRLALVKNDIALKSGHVRLYEYVTIPLLKQKQTDLEVARAQLINLHKVKEELKREALSKNDKEEQKNSCESDEHHILLNKDTASDVIKTSEQKEWSYN